MPMGFTLIEMLMVMAIIVIMTGLVFAAYRTGQRRYTLNQAAQRLTADLRKAQNMSISGSGFSGSYSGYGIYAKIADSSVSYILYGDKNGNKAYQPSDDILERTALPEKVSIFSTSPSSGFDVFFIPPGPTTFINGKSLNDAPVPGATTITLRLGDGTASKIITVTPAGVISEH